MSFFVLSLYHNSWCLYIAFLAFFSLLLPAPPLFRAYSVRAFRASVQNETYVRDVIEQRETRRREEEERVRREKELAKINPFSVRTPNLRMLRITVADHSLWPSFFPLFRLATQAHYPLQPVTRVIWDHRCSVVVRQRQQPIRAPSTRSPRQLLPLATRLHKLPSLMLFPSYQ